MAKPTESRIRTTRYGAMVLSVHAYGQEQKRLPQTPFIISDIYAKARLYTTPAEVLKYEGNVLTWIGYKTREQLCENPHNGKKGRVFFLYDGEQPVYPEKPPCRIAALIFASDMRAEKLKHPYIGITVIARYSLQKA